VCNYEHVHAHIHTYTKKTFTNYDAALERGVVVMVMYVRVRGVCIYACP
jgi:hypothetical protein